MPRRKRSDALARKGRPPYEPTEKDRRVVRAMTAWKAPQKEICTALAISDTTLRKHFRQEVTAGFIEAQNRMWQSLYEQGIGSPAVPATKDTPARPAIPPDVRATIAWLKFRGGAV